MQYIKHIPKQNCNTYKDFVIFRITLIDTLSQSKKHCLNIQKFILAFID